MGRIGPGAGVNARDEERIGPPDGEPLVRAERAAAPGDAGPVVPGVARRNARLDVFGQLPKTSSVPISIAPGDPSITCPLMRRPASPFRFEHEDPERSVS